MNELDHLLWAVPNLEKACAEARELFGVEPALGGRHEGLGTRNALLDLGEGRYLEFIAPDPTQELEGTLGGGFLAMPEPLLYSYAVSCSGFNQVRSNLQEVGLDMAEPLVLSRNSTEGRLMEWRIAMVVNHDFGSLAPFLIDWGSTMHPSSSAPKGCYLQSFEVYATQPDKMTSLIRAMECGYECVVGMSELVAEISTPNGNFRLSSQGLSRSQK